MEERLRELLERHGAVVSFDRVLSWREDPATGDVIFVTDAGHKIRVSAAGAVEVLLGPQGPAAELVEAPEPVQPIEAVAEDLPPLEPLEEPAAVPAEPPALDAAGQQEALELDLARVERFHGAGGLWYFRGVARNGEIVYPSEGYVRKADATRAARALATRFGVEVTDA